MPALYIYSNVENTALAILAAKGYRVWRNTTIDELMAEKDGWDFMGQTACELLAAVAIFEFQAPASYREYWWRVDAPDDLWARIPTDRPDYISVTERRDRP